jgi:hypothetical protein
MNLMRFEFGLMISFDMVLLCFWYGLGYGLDMVLEYFRCDFEMVLIWFGNGASFSGFLTGWLQERKRKQPRDSLLVDFSRVFVVLILWFVFDTILKRSWHDCDMILIRFWYGSSELASEKETETAQGQVFGRFFKDFYGFDMILIWLWYDFDTLLIRFWYDFDTVLIWFQWVGIRKRNRNSPGTGFWSFFEGFWGFDMILIRFWYAFDATLIRFWFVFDTILDMVPMDWLQIACLTQSRIRTETISKSYLKPYQHHNSKTTPETIHNNKHIWNVWQS